MKRWIAWAVIAVLSAGLLMAGCSDDDDPMEPGDQTDEPTVYATPDLLVEGFAAIYAAMDPDEFRWLVHPDARFIILPGTLAEWEGALTGDHFDHDALLSIHDNIFSGQQGLDASGSSIPPVASLEVLLMEKAGPWAAIPAADPDFGGSGGLWTIYNLRIYFNHPDQHRWQLQAQVAFYVAEVAVGEQSGWQFLGWHEIDANLVKTGTESITWCQILAMYR